MGDTKKELVERIRRTAASGRDRNKKAEQIAEAIRQFGEYRWVGVYDVAEEMVSIIAWSGPGAPAFPSFPAAKGLTGAAIREKRPVVVGDVRNDPRYLTTFGSSLSEIIIPVIHSRDARVLGTVDVESEKADAFSDQDQAMLEECGQAALPLWITKIE